MNRYSPVYDNDAESARMALDDKGSWVHVSTLREAAELVEKIRADNDAEFEQSIDPADIERLAALLNTEPR